MISVESIYKLSLEEVYVYRNTQQFASEFKNLTNLVEQLERKVEKTNVEEEVIVTLYFILGKMKEVINLLRLRETISVRLKFIEAVALRHLGYLLEAAKKLENLLKTTAVNREIASKELIEVYLMLGKFTQAEEIFNKELQENDSSFSRFIKARLLEYQNAIDEAVEIYEELLKDEKLKPEALHRLFYLACIYLEPEKIQRYEEEIRRLPSPPISLVTNLALYYDMRNKTKQAVEQVEFFPYIYSDKLHYLLDEIKTSAINFYDEDVERQKRQAKKLYEIPLDATELSIRTRNVLHQKGIRTIGDLTKYTEEDIKSIPTLGESGFKELKDLLIALNLDFAKVTQVESEHQKKYVEQLEQSIATVFWTPKTRSILDRHNIKVWGDLANLKEEEIKKWENVDSSVINEIRQKLLQQGLKFKS